MKKVPKNPATMQEHDGIGAGHRPRAEDPERQERIGGPGLADDEADQGDEVAAAPASVSIDVQPTSLVRMIVRTPSIRAPVTSDRAGHVGPVAEPEALVVLEQAEREERGDDPDRDVDEEDPVPVEGLGQDAAGEEADRGAGRGDEAVEADRLASARAPR